MSRLIYTVRAECRTCSHEQDVEIQMYDGFSDQDKVKEALSQAADECAGCYEINWTPLLSPEVQR